jgi:protein SCO1/2
MTFASRFCSHFLVLAFLLAQSSCGRVTRKETTDITGVMPSLSFSMTRANDGMTVDAADYRGKAVLLYFGYTHCPDECPATLANLAGALKCLGTGADKVRVLFVTVDPNRDTLPILKSYVEAFAPQIDGLRGSANALAALARRYRVIYAQSPASPGQPYSMMHSDSLFGFDRSGRARFVTTRTDNACAVAELVRPVE